MSDQKSLNISNIVFLLVINYNLLLAEQITNTESGVRHTGEGSPIRSVEQCSVGAPTGVSIFFPTRICEPWYRAREPMSANFIRVPGHTR